MWDGFSQKRDLDMYGVLIASMFPVDLGRAPPGGSTRFLN